MASDTRHMSFMRDENVQNRKELSPDIKRIGLYIGLDILIA